MTDPTIMEAGLDFEKEGKKLEQNEKRTSWYTQQDALHSVCNNIRAPLDKAYYEQLENLMGYKIITVQDNFKHLGSTQYKMDTEEVKKTTAKFYEPWNQIMQITKFRKYLDKDQAYLKTVEINVSDKSKLQFYVWQMLGIRMFKKRNIISKEDTTKVSKTQPEETKYLQKLVASNERRFFSSIST